MPNDNTYAQVKMEIEKWVADDGPYDLLTFEIEGERRADAVRMANYVRSLGYYCKILAFGWPMEYRSCMFTIGVKRSPFTKTDF